PIATKAVERGGSTRIAVVSEDPALGDRSVALLSTILNSADDSGRFDVQLVPDAHDARNGVHDPRYHAASVTTRGETGQLVPASQLGETMGTDRLTKLTLGLFGVAVLDYASRNPSSGFEVPDTQVFRSSGGGGSGPVAASAYASRLIVGAVFGI